MVAVCLHQMTKDRGEREREVMKVIVLFKHSDPLEFEVDPCETVQDLERVVQDTLGLSSEYLHLVEWVSEGKAGKYYSADGEGALFFMKKLTKPRKTEGAVVPSESLHQFILDQVHDLSLHGPSRMPLVGRLLDEESRALLDETSSRYLVRDQMLWRTPLVETVSRSPGGTCAVRVRSFPSKVFMAPELDRTELFAHRFFARWMEEHSARVGHPGEEDRHLFAFVAIFAKRILRGRLPLREEDKPLQTVLGKIIDDIGKPGCLSVIFKDMHHGEGVVAGVQ